MSAAVTVFDYEGYTVETFNPEYEQSIFNCAIAIQKEYAGKGMTLGLPVCRNIVLFEEDPDLYFDDEITSPSGLDADRVFPVDLTGKTDEEIESAILAQAISDAYGCAISCKPNYAVEDETEYAFPSVDAWVAWHTETVERKLEK